MRISRLPSMIVLFCAAFAILINGGCSEEQLLTPEETESPDTTERDGPDTTDPEEPQSDSLFARYVAIGSGTTAGYQAGGINQQTQSESYAVLVAKAMGIDFNVPFIEMPGCPPPIVDIRTGERLSDESCTGRVDSDIEIVHNVAAPGMYLRDLFETPAEESLRSLMLGGRTHLEAVADADPTFVTVWLGYSELVDHFQTGTPADPWTGMDNYFQLLDSLDAMNVQGVAIIRLPNPLGFPWWSASFDYIQAKEDGLLPATFEFAEGCQDWHSVPFDYGLQLLERATTGEQATLECWDSEPVVDRWESDPVNGIDALHTELGLEARQRGWAVVSVDLAGACDIPEMAVLSNSDEPTFGNCFSEDGIHLSAEGHRVVANSVIRAINETYGTNLPAH